MMEVRNVIFLDSLNYLPMALSKLPKGFGLGDNYKKGYLLHLFNITANANYIGPLSSPMEYYIPDILKEDDTQKLVEWHTELTNQNCVFDFQKEIVEYYTRIMSPLSNCLKYFSTSSELHHPL
ncbi:hypothetical protein NQ315_003574 [Exocentrus adspersus]|uniref:Uncharacterized protein n=1 Tax=Exocentrus adspersus TaxID=1586481 RepID=A0AAV8V9V1_9CUCU|nr:hypothetical protein NQ315_003574 [Exocentrus adspersus]